MHLVEDPEAQAALDDACDVWDGALVAWEAATWVLLRDPSIGVPINESGSVRAFTYEGARSLKQPTITILFEVSGDTTYVRAAKFDQPKYQQAGRA